MLVEYSFTNSHNINKFFTWYWTHAYWTSTRYTIKSIIKLQNKYSSLPVCLSTKILDVS